MNRSLVERIADAVLYEGYILYPYRPSVKNRQRWTFGGLYPDAYCRAQGGGDAASNQTECLVQGDRETTLNVTVRFLQLTERTVGELATPLAEWAGDREPPYCVKEGLRIGEREYYPWQEAEERTIELTGLKLGESAARAFAFSGKRRLEPLAGPDGQVRGVLVREQQALAGTIEAETSPAGEGLFKLTLRVENRTPFAGTNREAALLRSLVSTHAILDVRHGMFVSLLDPPDHWADLAAGCKNIGTWPVLVGEEGMRDTMLSSPIILYDYPQIAPESPGDLFDGTEIDEILTLRILTLTEEEKQAAAALDGRSRELLARTESLAREQLSRLHGTIRGVRPLSGEDV